VRDNDDSFIVPITCFATSEETTSIVLVLLLPINKVKFGGKRAFFLEAGNPFLCRCLNLNEIYSQRMRCIENKYYW